MRFTCTVDRDVFEQCERRLMARREGETVQDRVRKFLVSLSKELDPKREKGVA